MRGLVALALILFPIPAAADILIDNVNGVTVDETGEIARFDGLLIDDDGLVGEVFDRKDKRPKKVDYKLDGKGRVLVPGMIDSHAQVMDLGFSLLKNTAGSEAGGSAKPRPEDRDLAFAKAQQALLAAGITTIADMGTTIENWQTYRRAGDTGRLRMRVIAYADGVENMVLIGGPGPTPWLYQDRLKLSGVMLKLDGPLESRDAWLKAPYTDAPDKTGKPLMSDDQLRNLMSRAAIDNFQVAVRARGDAAGSAALDAIEELSDTYKGDRRWRIENADLVDPADFARFGQHGIVASMQPRRQTSSRTIAEARLGPARLAGAYADRSIHAAGAHLALGSDAVIAVPRPFADIAAALTRQDGEEQPFGGWQPQERLTREDALAGYTSEGAHALFAENRLGRIAKGLRADFLFIDADPTLATAQQLREMQVLETWVNGQKVYEAKGSRSQNGSSEGR